MRQFYLIWTTKQTLLMKDLGCGRRLHKERQNFVYYYSLHFCSFRSGEYEDPNIHIWIYCAFMIFHWFV